MKPTDAKTITTTHVKEIKNGQVSVGRISRKVIKRLGLQNVLIMKDPVK